MLSKGRIKIFKVSVCVSTTEGGENKHTSNLVSSAGELSSDNESVSQFLTFLRSTSCLMAALGWIRLILKLIL